MQNRVFYSSDGEMLIVPQLGDMLITTEFGRLNLSVGEIAVIPRGVRFSVNPINGPIRGYICENYGHPFVLLFEAKLAHSPFDVVAWVGNSAPYKYDLSRFNVMNCLPHHLSWKVRRTLTSLFSLQGGWLLKILFAHRITTEIL